MAADRDLAALDPRVASEMGRVARYTTFMMGRCGRVRPLARQFRPLRASGCSLLPAPRDADAIQAVQAQRMAFADAGVLEVLVCVIHADPLRHRARAQTADGGERNDFGQRESLERDAKAGSRGLARVAVIPGSTRQLSADLDARRKASCGEEPTSQ